MPSTCTPIASTVSASVCLPTLPFLSSAPSSPLSSRVVASPFFPLSLSSLRMPAAARPPQPQRESDGEPQARTRRHVTETTQ